jgi:hypothetical protein
MSVHRLAFDEDFERPRMNLKVANLDRARLVVSDTSCCGGGPPGIRATRTRGLKAW